MIAGTVGVIGGGRIARILLGGWARAGVGLSGVVVSDANAEALSRLRAEHPTIEVATDNREAAKQDLVLLALHPPAFAGALHEIREALAPETVLVSLAPVWTMSRIREALGGFGRLARSIPNAPSIVCRGFNPVCFSEQLPGQDRARLLAWLSPLGACPEVAENTLEAYAVVAAMGPTYLWYQLYQLADLGIEFGLTRAAATEAVVAMATGAAEAIASSGMTPDGVMDLIPVRPLAALEPSVKEAYVTTLSSLHAKLSR